MITPSQEYRRTGHAKPAAPLKGLDAAVNSMIGRYRRRASAGRQLHREAEQIDALAPEFKELTSHHLQQRLREFRDQFRRGGRAAEACLVPALAAIREAADRQLGLRPFNVQLMGALALHRGLLAEMATGEGKTLTAGLAAVLAGWTRHPTHIVTVNDYLVKRDAQRLGPLYAFCGVRVDYVTAPMPPVERRKGYAADVTYCTSKELLADFLRDRLRLGILRNPTRRLIRRMLQPNAPDDGVVLRGLHTVIVDEADSVLIDEAVTPLIISTTHENAVLDQVTRTAHQIATPLEPGVHYRVDSRYREVELTDAGEEILGQTCESLPGLWRSTDRRKELIRQALIAREFFLRGKQYVLVEGKVVIVDEFTGRQMDQRKWRQGLHQAIEAKEGLPLSGPTETIARLSFQRFFRLFHKLSGMTGTAHEAAGEFWQIYRLAVVAIPTNKPCIREHWPDRVFADEADKWTAVAEEIARLHATHRPVLIGTRSVESSERLADLLTQRGLPFRLLNAVRHEEEAGIIAIAGDTGQITIATNMAGRGTDIVLEHKVANLGGLHVLATERHESGRVDRQLFGRAARQGDPGSAQAFVSATDELLRRHLPAAVQKRVASYARGRLPGAPALVKGSFAQAQRNAQALAFKQRIGVLQMDDRLEDALSFAGTDVV